MRFALASFGLIVFGLPALGAVYTPASGFSLSGNPNGPWSFGYRTQVADTSLNLFTNPIVANLSVWDRGLSFPQNYPRVVKNTSNEPIFWGGDVALQPGEFGMHPGQNVEFCVTRFTVPHDGLWDFSHRMTSLDRLTDGIAGYVVKNGQIVFSDTLPGGVAGVQIGGDVTGQVLVAGDIIEFVTGASGNFTGDTIRLDATIVAVPAPSSIGLLMLTACARRRPSRR